MCKFVMAALVASFSISVVIAADDPRTIVEQSQLRNHPKSQVYEGILKTYKGRDLLNEKRWIYERTGSAGESKAIIRFTQPAEVKGVALLIVNHPDRASDQWMWTPAVERDRRIALQDRSTIFFGTDFSFEDLEERDVDQYDYKSLGDAMVDNALCWKILATPKGKVSQYTKSIVWIRKDNYATIQVESYKGDDLVRRLGNTNIRNIQGIYTPREMTMAQTKKGTYTVLTLEEVHYNVPSIKPENFTLQAIRRQ